MQVGLLKDQIKDLQGLPAGPLLPDNLQGRDAPGKGGDTAFAGLLDRENAKAVADDTTAALKLLDTAQLDAAKSAAFATQDTVLYTAVLAEEERRVGASAAAHKAWTENLDRIGNSEWVQSLKDLSDAELDTAINAARANENVADFNVLMAESANRAKTTAESVKLITAAEGELHTLLSGETIPAYEQRAQALEAQAAQDEAQRVRLLQLADAIRGAGAVAEANKEKLNVTLHVAGIDTGLKALDLYKSAIQGVGSVISKTFEDMVAGTGSGVNSILQNMALMALGIVKQVAVAIVAYEAQAIALAIISGASFNFVQAGLALAAAAAVAGIVAGLESKIKGGGVAVPTAPASGGGSVAAPGSVVPPPDNTLVNIPNSAVTVVAAPEWTAVMVRVADKMDRAADKLLDFSDRPVRVQSTVRVEQPSGGIGPFALTTP